MPGIGHGAAAATGQRCPYRGIGIGRELPPDPHRDRKVPGKTDPEPLVPGECQGEVAGQVLPPGQRDEHLVVGTAHQLANNLRIDRRIAGQAEQRGRQLDRHPFLPSTGSRGTAAQG
jgi:hypothetical protein